jgi:Helix-turn-helix domain
LSDTSAVFFTVVEAATFLRISPITLGRWRIEGYGRPYRKFGRRVVYARDDLLAWANQQARSSTSDKG